MIANTDTYEIFTPPNGMHVISYQNLETPKIILGFPIVLLVVNYFRMNSQKIILVSTSLNIFLIHINTMIKMSKKLKLSEEEKVVLAVSSQDVSNSKHHAKFSTLFRLQISKEFNKEVFRSTIHKLWQGSHGVTIKEVGNNLSLAIFTSEEDMMKVLDRSPWSFDRRLILMKQFNGDLSPGNVSFHYNKSELW